MALRAPPSIRPVTLGEMVAEGVNVVAWCDRCGHSAVLDVGPLADRLGSGTPVPALRQVLKCSRCGGRDVAVQRDQKYKGPLDR